MAVNLHRRMVQPTAPPVGEIIARAGRSLEVKIRQPEQEIGDATPNGRSNT